MSDTGDVDFIGSECACYFFGSCNLFSIKPDVRAKVDAVEMEPNIFVTVTRGQMKLGSIPPRRPKRAIVRHWEVRKVRPDWITASGYLSEVLIEHRIRINLVLDECADDSRWDLSRIPSGS